MEIEVIDPLDVSLGHSPEMLREQLKGVTQPDTHRRPLIRMTPRRALTLDDTRSPVARWPLVTVILSTLAGVICGAKLTKKRFSV